MGYCARCGDHSIYEVGTKVDKRRERSVVRIAAKSRIITLPNNLQEGSIVSYGGARFTVRFEGDDFLLDAAD